MPNTLRVVLSSLTSLVVFVLLLFWPAGTLHYSQGWAFLGVFAVVSLVPTAVCVLGLVMVAAGLGTAMLVVIQNRYAAANIVVEKDQPLVTTGLYGVVRHPMYSGSVVMMIGMPLALGSYWALLVTIAALVLLVIRIVDEEKMLTQEMTGYRDYMQKVHYRLVPLAW